MFLHLGRRNFKIRDDKVYFPRYIDLGNKLYVYYITENISGHNFSYILASNTNDDLPVTSASGFVYPYEHIQLVQRRGNAILTLNDGMKRHLQNPIIVNFLPADTYFELWNPNKIALLEELITYNYCPGLIDRAFGLRKNL